MDLTALPYCPQAPPETDMDLSIVVPVYNEEESLPHLYQRLTEVLEPTVYSYELVFVDDGSDDAGLEVLKGFEADDPRVVIVQLTRNFGQHAALAAGLSIARGRFIATIDADLQIDPRYIVPMVQKAEEGHDFVGGIRRDRGDSLFMRRLPSRLLNVLIGWVTGRRLKDYGCPLNVMQSKIAKKMPEYGDMQKFFKPLAIRLSRTVAEVEVHAGQRIAGHSKYGLFSLVDLFFDFITNFSKQLFQRVAILGLFLSGVSFLSGSVYLGLRFLVGLLHQSYDRFLVLVLLGLFFGTQLLVLGVLGDFIIRIYRKSAPTELYRIEKIS